MKFSLKLLAQQTIVITGASSGIGLATARAAAAQGANVVLAARNDEALDAIVHEINQSETGGRAIHVAADVSRREDLQRVAAAAVERFGGFDTWVNNAGVSIYGRVEETAEDDARRLFETNFWGVANGSVIALQYLKSRGGALINVGSVASDSAIPLQGFYSASKHAIKGLTDALRIELEAESAPVSVTLIKPGAIDTPFPHHAKNYLAEEPKHAPPVYVPEEVARAILFAATHPKRDIYVGSSARAMSTLSRMAPQVMDRAGPMLMQQQRRDEAARDPEGALHHAGYGGQERGDQPGRIMRRSFYTRSSMHPALTGALIAAAGIATVAVVRSKRRRAWDGDMGASALRDRRPRLTGVR